KGLTARLGAAKKIVSGRRWRNLFLRCGGCHPDHLTLFHIKYATRCPTCRAENPACASKPDNAQEYHTLNFLCTCHRACVWSLNLSGFLFAWREVLSDWGLKAKPFFSTGLLNKKPRSAQI